MTFGIHSGRMVPIGTKWGENMSENNVNLMRELSKCTAILNRIYCEYGNSRNLDNTENCILYSIASFDSISQRDLVNEYSFPKQTVNNIIKRLEENGYIKLVSSEKDKRSKVIKLTIDGIKYAEKILKPIIEKETIACDSIGSEKLSMFIELFNEINEAFRNAFKEA